MMQVAGIPCILYLWKVAKSCTNDSREVARTAAVAGTVPGMAAKKRQTMGKLIRERERAEKRARKQEKKEAKKALAAMEAEAPQPEVAEADAEERPDSSLG
jgi:hypothetical protein